MRTRNAKLISFKNFMFKNVYEQSSIRGCYLMQTLRIYMSGSSKLFLKIYLLDGVLIRQSLDLYFSVITGECENKENSVA